MELIGRRFGHIRVTGVVGQGGMGDVYSAYDEKLERKVALKVLHAEQRLDHSARERLLREARALSKLDHAHICRIHDYLESDDVDVLVLEYIDGITLDDVFRENPARGEKLRIAIGIAEVLVAAHRAGIIHRDLKPENVMLTKSREVKVLDFGLARWLQLARVRSSDRHRAVNATVVPIGLARAETLPLPDNDGASPHATAAGVTLGTPLFMSPEQARGETLTPASDMYSFGLLLQALFTGRDPYPDDLTSREVMQRAARGETNPVTGVAGDVTALINRLKQFAPADRPTAIETVERLTFLQNKPQRIARRAVAALVVMLMATGGWRYAIDLQRERSIALAAQTEAETRRAQAENLIEFMLGDLRKKLEPVGRLDILDDVGKRAIEYVESVDPKTMSADELTRSAKALNQLGDVRLAQGNTPEALRMFRHAEQLTTEAVRRDPRNGEVLMAHGATQFWLGNSLRLEGDMNRALEHMRNYMRDGDALAALDQGNREYQLERAYGHSGVALILEARGDLAAALNHYQVSRDVKELLARRAPDDAAAQADLGRAYNKLAGVLYKLGDLRGARDMGEREVAISRGLVSREPKQAQWKQRLTTSLSYLARVLFAIGDRDRAFALWSEELAIERELAALDPENVDWQRNVAVTARRVAIVLAERGEHARAMPLFVESHEGLVAAIRRAPSRHFYKNDLAGTEIEYGRALAQSGNVAAGRKLIAAGIDRLSKLPAGERRTQYGLGYGHLALGEVLRSSDPAAARRAWEAAERELEPVVRVSDDPDELAILARVFVRRARGADAQGLMSRLASTGYDTASLRTLCRETGCEPVKKEE